MPAFAQDGVVKMFGLVIGKDGRAKVDDWNRLTPEERKVVEDFNKRIDYNGCDPSRNAS